MYYIYYIYLPLATRAQLRYLSLCDPLDEAEFTICHSTRITHTLYRCFTVVTASMPVALSLPRFRTVALTLCTLYLLLSVSLALSLSLSQQESSPAFSASSAAAPSPLAPLSSPEPALSFFS